jgi:hypothetical protein
MTKPPKAKLAKCKVGITSAIKRREIASKVTLLILKKRRREIGQKY